MSGLFDRLRSELEKRHRGEGIRPTDLLTLPPAQRRVMKLLLREVQLSYPEIETAVSTLPEKQRLTSAQIEITLAELTEAGWIIRMGQDELITFRVNLRRKSGSQVAQDMWGSLAKRLKERQASREANER